MNFQRRSSDPILTRLDKLQEVLLSALDDKTLAIQTAITQLGTDLTKVISDLRAAIAAGGPPTAAQLAALDAIATSLTTLDTQAKAE
jgi:hypothetical protein